VFKASVMRTGIYIIGKSHLRNPSQTLKPGVGNYLED